MQKNLLGMIPFERGRLYIFRELQVKYLNDSTVDEKQSSKKAEELVSRKALLNNLFGR